MDREVENSVWQYPTTILQKGDRGYGNGDQLRCPCCRISISSSKRSETSVKEVDRYEEVDMEVEDGKKECDNYKENLENPLILVP